MPKSSTTSRKTKQSKGHRKKGTVTEATDTRDIPQPTGSNLDSERSTFICFRAYFIADVASLAARKSNASDIPQPTGLNLASERRTFIYFSGYYYY
jgi:hypothetical protein